MAYAEQIKQGNSNESTRQAGEIPRYSDDIEKHLHGCLEGIETLESRLGGVLRSSPPTANGSTGQTPTAVAQSGLGQRLQGHGNLAASLYERIDDLTRRLEV